MLFGQWMWHFLFLTTVYTIHFVLHGTDPSHYSLSFVRHVRFMYIVLYAEPREGEGKGELFRFHWISWKREWILRASPVTDAYQENVSIRKELTLTYDNSKTVLQIAACWRVKKSIHKNNINTTCTWYEIPSCPKYQYKLNT